MSKSCFFLDSLIFFAFVQNNYCGAKLKAISCSYNLRNFLPIAYIYPLHCYRQQSEEGCIDNIIRVKYKGVHSNLAMTVCSNYNMVLTIKNII